MSDVRGAQPMRREGSAGRTVRVWDPLVRVLHWGLVAAFAIAWLTADELQPVHELAGYTVAGLVAFRVIWVSSVAATRGSRSSSPVRPRRSAIWPTL
jgi:cytochrome b